MSEPVSTDAAAAANAVCAQCARPVDPATAVLAGGKTFCRSCYESLHAELQAIAAATSTDINYFGGAIGALLGGLVGALAWWGFTVLTQIAFGLFAVAIGYLVGQGTVRFSGGKRSRGLQAMSVAVALLSYAVAIYLVNMTFINRAFASRGDSLRLSLVPTSPDLFFRVVSMGFGAMDFVFLAIVVWEAWKIPRPLSLPPQVAA